MPMKYETIPANDGCALAYQTSIPLQNSPDGPARNLNQPLPSKLIILLHGFSGSSAYFTRNFGALSSSSDDGHSNWVIAPDMRGHGNSGRPRGGYHVARLASDLRDLIAFFRQTYINSVSSLSASPPEKPLQIVAVGCSIGAAILWTYIELFGWPDCKDFDGLVFVDQAPLQDAAWYEDGDADNWDGRMHHRGLFDEASLKNAQKAWMLPFPEVEGTYKALVDECLGYRQDESWEENLEESLKAQAEEDEKFFMEISKACDGKWLARLMADHTRYDHREAIEMISVPALVMAGRKSGCFPLEGMLETARRIENGQAERGQDKGKSKVEVSVSVFECGHWLFYEDSERFSREILAFVERCTE